MKYSNKAITINAIDNMREANTSGEGKLLFITSFGMITAKVDGFVTQEDLKKEIEANGSASVGLSYVCELRDQTISSIKKDEPDAEILPDGAMLNLINVNLYVDNLKAPILTINSMILFVDQIIAVSLVPGNF